MDIADKEDGSDRQLNRREKQSSSKLNTCDDSGYVQHLDAESTNNNGNANQYHSNNSNNNNSGAGSRRPWNMARIRMFLISPKFLIGFTAASWGFLTSVERSVVLSTMFLYLKKYISDESNVRTFYAIAAAAFGLAILVMTPVFGVVAQFGVRVRNILIFANSMEIFGNLLYMIGTTPIMVVLGRFLAGIGASCEPPLYADVAKATTIDERTPVIVVILVSRQLGLLIGPAFTLFLTNMNVTVAGFELTVYNGPGLLMACLWLIHTIFLLLAYPLIDNNGRQIYSGIRLLLHCCLPTNKLRPSVVSKTTGNRAMADSLGDMESVSSTEEEDAHLIRESSSSAVPSSHSGTTNARCCTRTRLAEFGFVCTNRARQCRIRCDYQALRKLFTYPPLTMFAVSFAVYFSFMCLETVLPPVANERFDWGEVEISYVYLSAGGLILFFCVLLHGATYYFADRALVLFGCACLLIAYVWLAIVCAVFSVKSTKAIVITMLGISLHVLGMPFATACSESLYSKLVDVKDMNYAQSVLRTVINVAFLFGQFFGGVGSAFPTVVFAIMGCFIACPLLMLAIRFDRFALQASAGSSTNVDSSDDASGGVTGVYAISIPPESSTKHRPESAITSSTPTSRINIELSKTGTPQSSQPEPAWFEHNGNTINRGTADGGSVKSLVIDETTIQRDSVE